MIDEETLIEIEDYVKQLDEKVGLKSETVEDIRCAVERFRSELRRIPPNRCDHDYSDGTGAGWNICKKCGDQS